MTITIIKKAKAAWSGQRTVWRLDIQYVDGHGASKRTFLNVTDAEPHKTRGEAEAKRAAKEFGRGVGTIYQAFWDKVGMVTVSKEEPVEEPEKAPEPVIRSREPTISWLLGQCLKHPDVWGRVKHSKNYKSAVSKLNGLIGDRPCADFEAPHGRKIVITTLTALRDAGFSDGYIRKLMYHLRQALCALIGEGVTEPIYHPVTGEPLISDVPTFPSMAKSKGRTAVLEREQDTIVFQCIGARIKRAAAEEKAFAEKIGPKHLLGLNAKGPVDVDGRGMVWINPRRFSADQWRNFGEYTLFLLETGCRRSEALSVGNHSLRTREVTDDHGGVVETFEVLHLPGEVTKSGLPRDINISPALLKNLPVWKAKAGQHAFQIGDRTVEIPRAWFRLDPHQITHMWAHIRKDAMAEHGVDLSKVSPHQLRHTHATRMSARGLSGKALSETLGHTDERTTRIYDHAQQVHNSRKFFQRNVTVTR
jgi:integrase